MDASHVPLWLLFIYGVSDEQHRCYEHKRCTDDQDIQRIGKSHVCLLALTVRYYVGFVSDEKKIVCCDAVTAMAKAQAFRRITLNFKAKRKVIFG